MIALLILLLAVHALCDFPLQSDFLARAKARNGIPGVPFQWALLWHAYLHAVGVALVTGRLYPGIIEFVAHTAIDHAKCRNKFGENIVGAGAERAFTTDQLLHIATKVVIVGLRWRGWV